MFCTKCGKKVEPYEKYCSGCGCNVIYNPDNPNEPLNNPINNPINNNENESMYTNYIAGKIAGYEKTSSILWIILGALQIIGCVTIIAGIWNLIMGINGLSFSSSITPRNQTIVSTYESKLGIIIASIFINLILGGFIGIFINVFDIYIRDQVIKNKEVFGVNY